jgi:AMMECR1 domain-containing protein
MVAPSNRFHRVEEAPPEAVCVELWSDGGIIRGSVECPTGGMSGSLVPFVPPEAGMSAEEALATACHLANVDGREVVIIDRFDLWRSEWGSLS